MQLRIRFSSASLPHASPAPSCNPFQPPSSVLGLKPFPQSWKPAIQPMLLHWRLVFGAGTESVLVVVAERPDNDTRVVRQACRSKRECGMLWSEAQPQSRSHMLRCTCVSPVLPALNESAYAPKISLREFDRVSNFDTSLPAAGKRRKLFKQSGSLHSTPELAAGVQRNKFCLAATPTRCCILTQRFCTILSSSDRPGGNRARR